RYNKPLQASVRAVTKGTLWALKREDFRGILMSEFSNLSSLKLLRSVDLLSRLSILQLSQISDCLSEVTFSSGQTIIDKNEVLALYIIQKGRVKLTFDADLLTSPNTLSLKSDIENEDDDVPSETELSIEKPEGSYFGEWSLLDEQIGSLTAVAEEDVVCALLTKDKFESVIGSLQKISQEDHKYVLICACIKQWLSGFCL
ncbi:protein phosphatase 2C and cyclic nucleotide-binding kinase domain-containing, partial [Trifolium pratense]